MLRLRNTFANYTRIVTRTRKKLSEEIDMHSTLYQRANKFMFLRVCDVVSCSTRRFRFMIIKQCFVNRELSGPYGQGNCVATLHVFARTMMINSAIVQSCFSSFVRNKKKKTRNVSAGSNEKKKCWQHQASNIIMI